MKAEIILLVILMFASMGYYSDSGLAVFTGYCLGVWAMNLDERYREHRRTQRDNT